MECNFVARTINNSKTFFHCFLDFLFACYSRCFYSHCSFDMHIVKCRHKVPDLLVGAFFTFPVTCWMWSPTVHESCLFVPWSSSNFLFHLLPQFLAHVTLTDWNSWPCGFISTLLLSIACSYLSFCLLQLDNYHCH